MEPSTLRGVISPLLVSAWLVLLMAGVSLGGAVHLLLFAALALFPWRLLATGEP